MEVTYRELACVPSSYPEKNWVIYSVKKESKIVRSCLLIKKEIVDHQEIILSFLKEHEDEMVGKSKLSKNLKEIISRLYESENDMLFVEADEYTEDEFTALIDEIRNVIPESYADTYEFNTDAKIVLFSDFQSIINFAE